MAWTEVRNEYVGVKACVKRAEILQGYMKYAAKIRLETYCAATSSLQFTSLCQHWGARHKSIASCHPSECNACRVVIFELVCRTQLSRARIRSASVENYYQIIRGILSLPTIGQALRVQCGCSYCIIF